MRDIKYNLQFEKLCSAVKLGELLGEPEALSGGLLHRMYTVKTNQGKYAIKALNPQIMLRPTAMKNYINSERIVRLADNNVPALPARRFNDASIQEIENQFYLIFDWVGGTSLRPDEINIAHCEKIGTILASIHKTDFSELGITNVWTDNEQPTDWNYYLQKGQENNGMWVSSLGQVVDKLYDWSSNANDAARLLSSNMVISHRDLDPKNVLWDQDKPIVIDWEAAGYVNPMQELVETAIYWSEDETGNLDIERFIAFIGGYKKIYGTLDSNWRIVLESGFLGKLGWLEYNLKRSLGLECTDKEEQQLGTDQVLGTIGAIKHYADMICQLEQWLNKETQK